MGEKWGTDRQTNKRTHKHTERTNILAIFASNNIKGNNASSGLPQCMWIMFEGFYFIIPNTYVMMAPRNTKFWGSWQLPTEPALKLKEIELRCKLERCVPLFYLHFKSSLKSLSQILFEIQVIIWFSSRSRSLTLTLIQMTLKKLELKEKVLWIIYLVFCMSSFNSFWEKKSWIY